VGNRTDENALSFGSRSGSPSSPSPSPRRANKGGDGVLPGLKKEEKQQIGSARANLNEVAELVLQSKIAPNRRHAEPMSCSPRSARKKPKELASCGIEFRPPSRSSSEGGLTPPAANIGKASNFRKGGPSTSRGPPRTQRGESVSSSISSNRPSLTTCYVNFDKFDLQIENGTAPSQLVSWDQLLKIANRDKTSDDDGEESVRQAIDWYGWPSPTKFQAVAIPCIIQACLNCPDARSYTLLQAASGLGKTSALALGLLASVRRETKSLQYIVVALDACEDVERYMNSLGCLCPVKVAYFKGSDCNDVDDDIEAAKGAQIIVGHPSRVCGMLQAAEGGIVLEMVEVLLMDDAAEVITDGWLQKVCEINQLVSLFARNPLRYVVVSNFVEGEAKPALRTMKSSLMSKKNMFDLSQQVGRIRKFVKHYVMQGDPKDWIKTLSRLRDMIYIPRAVIFCDDEQRFQTLKKGLSKSAFDQEGAKMSHSVNDSKTQTPKERRENLASFAKEHHDFLLTRSEPNVFQATLPRVYWIIHFGVEPTNLSWYGCRLLCIDSQLREKASKGVQHDGVSILFLPKTDTESMSKLEKMFGIKFEGLPLVDMV